MANENGVTNGRGGPWWVTFIQAVGPTAAIAIFLTYILAAQVQPALDSIKGYMAQHVQQQQSVIDNQTRQSDIEHQQWEDLKGISATEHKDHEKSLAVQEQTCINAAKSSFQTQRCIDSRNAGEAQP